MSQSVQNLKNKKTKNRPPRLIASLLFLTTPLFAYQPDTHACSYWLGHLSDISVWEDIIVRIRRKPNKTLEDRLDIEELRDRIYLIQERADRENA